MKRTFSTFALLFLLTAASAQHKWALSGGLRNPEGIQFMVHRMLTPRNSLGIGASLYFERNFLVGLEHKIGFGQRPEKDPDLYQKSLANTVGKILAALR